METIRSSKTDEGEQKRNNFNANNNSVKKVPFILKSIFIVTRKN